MKPMIEITWNGSEAVVAVSKAFNELPWIVRADCLQDALIDLESVYHEALDEIAKHGEKA